MKIVLYPDPQLFKPTVDVTGFTPQLIETLEDMKHLMIRSKGLGLSANQVDGWLYDPPSMFVMMNSLGNFLEIINPVIVSKEGLLSAPEGCLSLPGIVANVTRPKTIEISHRDRDGSFHTSSFTGMDAKVVLHEIDHLTGRFFLDRIALRAKDKALKSYYRR